MSGNLFVNGDTSLNGFVDISGRVAIGKRNPTVALDISYTDAIRIPHGTTAQRPTTSTEASHGGYIRYNNENHQFEGYGPGNSWGSLGGVINVAQNTKIIASSPNADSSNNDLMFFTAPRWDISTNSSVERMRIDGSGNVGIGTTAPICTLHVDISNNPQQTFWTSMLTHTSLKSQKNSDLERYIYTANPTYDFKVFNSTAVNNFVNDYIIYRGANSFASVLPFGVTDIGGAGTDYRYDFEGTNLDLENYVKTNLSSLITAYIGTYPTYPQNGVTESNGVYNYDFITNNTQLEYYFIKTYITQRIIVFSGSGLPYGVTGTSGNYNYDFVKTIGSAIGKNTTGLNNSAEIKYWHIDDLSTSNALSFGFNQNSNKMFIRADGRTGIGTINPRCSVDISYTDALIIPSGSDVQRPLGPGETRVGFSHQAVTGMIRYNKTNSQFEGFGPGDSWGSLGGVINVAQNTKIIASSPNADSTNNELMFFTAPTGNVTMAAGVERMRIKADGDISMNRNIQIGQNVSLNSNTAQINMGSASTVIIKHNTASGLDIDSSGNIFINANYGTINLGNNAIAQNINIGSGASARTIQVGNEASSAVRLDASNIILTSVNALTLTDGSANFTMNGTGATTLSGITTFGVNASGSVSLNSSNGEINIGNDVVAQNINIGSGASARTIQVGNEASTTVYLDAKAVRLTSSLGPVNITGAAASSFRTTSGDLSLYAAGATGNVLIQAGSSAGIIVNSSGNVGIGTGTPVNKLDVNGDARIRGRTFFGNNDPGGGTGDTAYMEYIVNGTGETTCLKIVCENDPADNIALMTAGGVGIGTTVPRSKLDVTGGVIIGASYAGVQNGFANGLLVEGAVGVGTGDVGTYKLNVNGNVQAFSYNATSDVRLKTNIQPLTDSLELVNQLNGVSFTWKNDTTNKLVLGLIAQEVEKVLPDIVNTATTDNEDGYKQKSIHYDGLFPHLIESIKTLTQENKDLVSTVDVLTQENKALSAKVDKIMTILDKLNISV